MITNYNFEPTNKIQNSCIGKDFLKLKYFRFIFDTKIVKLSCNANQIKLKQCLNTSNKSNLEASETMKTYIQVQKQFKMSYKACIIKRIYIMLSQQQGINKNETTIEIVFAKLIFNHLGKEYFIFSLHQNFYLENNDELAPSALNKMFT